MQIGPNVLNSVPREARVEIDIRDIDAGRRDATVKRVLEVMPQASLTCVFGLACGGACTPKYTPVRRRIVQACCYIGFNPVPGGLPSLILGLRTTGCGR